MVWSRSDSNGVSRASGGDAGGTATLDLIGAYYLIRQASSGAPRPAPGRGRRRSRATAGAPSRTAAAGGGEATTADTRSEPAATFTFFGAELVQRPGADERNEEDRDRSGRAE